MINLKQSAVFVFLVLITFQVSAKVTLPRFVSDGLVLQRNIEIPVWGWAGVGETVKVLFKGKQYEAIAGKDRKWKLLLKKESAGGPYEMIVKGENSITIKNILIGDVWLCSGQSNMEYELYKSSDKYKNEIANSTNNYIRHFKVERRIGFNTSDNVESDSGWQSASPTSVLNFTAVGYFFAHKLYEKYKVPIGLINCSYGGTPVQAWMNENELKDFTTYYAKAMECKDTALVNKITLKDKNFTADWYKKIEEGDDGLKENWFEPSYNANDWKTMEMPNYWQDQGLKNVEGAVVWFRKEINVPASLIGKNAVLELGNIAGKDITYFNGIKVGSASSKYAPRRYEIQSMLVKEGSNIITLRVINENGNGGFIKDKPYQITVGDSVYNLAGSWQYKQGFSFKPLRRTDVTRFQDIGSAMYHGMLEPLIGYGMEGVIWYQGESNVSKADEYLPLFSGLINCWRNEWKQGDFPFLFVQLANNNAAKDFPDESKLARLQEAQSFALSLPNTGMAVINDIGEWNDVHPKNKLDVGKRLALAAQKVAYGDKAVVYSGPTYQSMGRNGNKIMLSFKNTGSGMKAKGGSELKYFSIADSSKKFIWAKAEIVGDKIMVWSDAIAEPIAVRYAWADNPVGANLINNEGLPASCFRTDNWSN